MQYLFTDGYHPDFISLCHQLDTYLNFLAGGEENRGQYIPYNQLDDIHHVILAYEANTPIGCISFKYVDDTCAEIKRFFLQEQYRGQGIGHMLLQQLENKAKENGYHCLILETGEPLQAAMTLYHKNGYHIIPNYGPYEQETEAICMRKIL